MKPRRRRGDIPLSLHGSMEAWKRGSVEAGKQGVGEQGKEIRQSLRVER